MGETTTTVTDDATRGGRCRSPLLCRPEVDWTRRESLVQTYPAVPSDRTVPCHPYLALPRHAHANDLVRSGT